MLWAQIEHLTGHHLAVLPDNQQVDPLENLENPAHRWGLGGVADLVDTAGRGRVSPLDGGRDPDSLAKG